MGSNNDIVVVFEYGSVKCAIVKYLEVRSGKELFDFSNKWVIGKEPPSLKRVRGNTIPDKGFVL